jgi:ribosomal protein S6
MAKKNEEINNELDQIDVAEPRVYELGFHLDGELAQEDLKKAYQEYREKIASVGTVIAEGEPVKLPLAYTISRMSTAGRRDFNSAFFCWIAYEADGAGHDQVAAMAREDLRVIRFLDIRSTVDEAKHSADMQEMFAQMAAAPVEQDETAELAPEAAPVAEAEAEPAAAPAAEEAA